MPEEVEEKRCEIWSGGDDLALLFESSGDQPEESEDVLSYLERVSLTASDS